MTTIRVYACGAATTNEFRLPEAPWHGHAFTAHQYDLHCGIPCYAGM